MRHASARNVIERIFGVVKRRFHILVVPPEYDMQTQARIPAALAALHNYIHDHDPSEVDDLLLEDDEVVVDDRDERAHASTGDLADGIAGRAERRRAEERQPYIANEMWNDYRRELRECGVI